MIDFEKEWAQATAHGRQLSGLVVAGSKPQELQSLEAAQWLRSKTKDLPRNWLVDTAMKYFNAIETGAPIQLSVKDGIHTSISYSGNWVRHLMAIQALLDPERSLDQQWGFIEKGVEFYLGYCKKQSVAGLMVEAMECALSFSNRGAPINTQRLIEIGCTAVGERAGSFCQETKSPVFVIFCPPEWPLDTDKQFYVAEATQYIMDNPDRMQFLRNARGNALKQLHATYSMDTLSPFLTERQIEDKFSVDLGL
jgi:hypothetical protein